MTTGVLTAAAGEPVLMAWEPMSRAEVCPLPVVDAHGRRLGVLDASPTLAWDATGPGRARRPPRWRG
ncbi:hypothetical protein [Actinomadura kijaniata]|uniref:hypothetical protein n=1 Tax=Actinomadura kijaniata TaxID=46161 RepID=UPI003F530909